MQIWDSEIWDGDLQEHGRRLQISTYLYIRDEFFWFLILNTKTRRNKKTLMSLFIILVYFSINLITFDEYNSEYTIKELCVFTNYITLQSSQFSSVAQLYPILCNPMDYCTPGFPVHHQLPELTQTHFHRVSDAIQLSDPLSSHSPPAFNLPQHQGLLQ